MEKLELRRQIFHLILGIILVFLFKFELITAQILFYILVAGSILSILSLKFKIPIITYFLRLFERPNGFPGKGAMFFVFGTLITILLFRSFPNIAYASISILSFGDSTSHLVGRFGGRIKTKLSKVKNIEGTFIGAIVAFAAASLFVSPILAFVGSFSAMLIECLEIKANDTLIDDNILIPLVAGTAMYLVVTNFSVFRFW